MDEETDDDRRRRLAQKISNLWFLKGNIVQHKKFTFERKMSLVLEGFLWERTVMAKDGFWESGVVG